MAIYDRDYMRDEPASLGGTLRNLTAFHWIFWINIAVFVAQYVLRIGWIEDDGAGKPWGGLSLAGLSHGEVWTPFTHMFVHGSLGHVLFNMFGLWFAGRCAQNLYGPRHFTLIYVLSGLVGAALQLLVAGYFLKQNQALLMGASASVLGLLLACAVALPREELSIMLFFVIPIRVKLWNLAMFIVGLNMAFGALQLFGVVGKGDTVTAWFAHLGGALVGWYYARTLGYGGVPVEIGSGWSSANRSTRRPQMARAARRPVVEMDMEAVRRRNPRNDPVVDLMRDEVDPILDKISDHGMHSLTDDERRILERASRQISRDKPDA